jgi:serine/threonine protein kinase
MAENSLPDESYDSANEPFDSSEENFTLSNFNTAAVFGDKLLPYVSQPDSSQQKDSPQQNISGDWSVTTPSVPILSKDVPAVESSTYKYCPRDLSTYTDTSLRFCLNCGTALEVHSPEDYEASGPMFRQTGNQETNERLQVPYLPTNRPRQKTCGICRAANNFENVFCDVCGAPFTVVGIPVENIPSLPQTREDNPETVVLPSDFQVKRDYEQNLYNPAILIEPGSVLEKSFRVVEYLGKGGFSDIYTVEDTRKYFSDVQVLKLVHHNIAETFSVHSAEALRDSYRSQYKAWKIISEKEPNYIVRFHDVEIIVGRVGLLMEYMEGGTLLDLVESWGGKPQTQEQLQHLVKLFIQACRALNVIHKYKLVHRDVKPQNFLLDPTRERCKLCDFELLDKKDENVEEVFTEVFSSNPSSSIAGTLQFMAPEAFDGKFSIKSDIFSLGVMFYFLLSGKYPFADGAKEFTEIVYEMITRKNPPQSLTDHNSLVSPSLDRLVQWCLEFDAEQRPDSLTDLTNRFLQLGISDEESNFSPVNLAQLLLKHLDPIDLRWLIEHLEKVRGFRSMSELPEFQHQDMIEEYCYTTSPFEILKEHCTGTSLYAIAEALKISRENFNNREDLRKEIVKALGFLEGEKQTHGLETIRRDLESSRIKFEGAETVAECRGHLDHSFAEVERAVSLLINFYGQMLYGDGLNNFLVKKTKGKPIEKMTFGEKVGVLRELCTQKPKAPLPERVERIFSFPIMSDDIFEKLGTVVNLRNRVFHNRTEFNSLHGIQSFGQRILQTAVELVKNIVSNPYTPRVVQITSLKNDIYGRHFYEGHDEKGKKEKIFTTYGLRVGQLYWFVPLTNPARINPIIFPFDEFDEKKAG